MIKAKVLADSENRYAHRLTTLEVTFPRIILAEINTHRAFSRNSASSRAIPVQRQIDQVMQDPFVPERFPVNRPGMSATSYFERGEQPYAMCKDAWLTARDHAVDMAHFLINEGVHKQISNRLLEPFMWHTAIISSTEWDNFFELRISEFAQPEMRQTAEAMRDAINASEPNYVEFCDWHLPLIEDDERWSLTSEQQQKISVARVAAVSYQRQHVKDHDKEYSRYAKLAEAKHLSPFEHVATPSSHTDEWANFRGWRQLRYTIERAS